jgi:hypothetical protein
MRYADSKANILRPSGGRKGQLIRGVHTASRRRMDGTARNCVSKPLTE